MTSRRVLVVDDDAAIRETFQRELTRWGYDVSLAESAEAALSMLHRVDPAVVITDVRMQGMDGVELLRVIRDRTDDTDVIVITAFEDMHTAIAAMKAGAFEYLVKPLDLDQIEIVLRRCVGDRTLRQRARQQADDAGKNFSLDRLAGRHASMIEVYKLIGQVAPTRTCVLIRGETGTGKELIARAMHHNSPWASEPFVAVNCTAIPDALLESELFGHRRGAFTGAVGDRRGRFALAGNGTIFLDEIGEMTPAFQAKLLRVLQERVYTPVGAERDEQTDARVIAATHRDLEALVRDGSFREDLYFRLRVVEIRVPALRMRASDIPLLAEHLVARAARALHRPSPTLSALAVRRLTGYAWPGNVRELENTLTRAVVLARGGVIDGDALGLGDAEAAAHAGDTPKNESLASAERLQVRRVLANTGGNKRRTARVLGISRARLDRLMEKHGIGGHAGLATRPADASAGSDVAQGDAIVSLGGTAEVVAE